MSTFITSIHNINLLLMVIWSKIFFYIYLVNIYQNI